ncbi:hypothetical protein EC846_1742 [Acinetobacter sp. BIGb0102]|uniref:hypothetical protein n=1 Tax=Acinetobacter sp. BIGb0102 TaxID=2485131 RepID=UPI000F4F03B4|nr:hypothetical protein [Acinetobacter sp. BIGb0102]RPE31039.1 hypothetical protein EC846_1742 [Acinetobacter sp. BIGb0102]
MATHYSRLQLKISSPLQYKNFSFQFLVVDRERSKTIFKDEGSFDHKGFGKWFHIFQPNHVLMYKVKYQGEVIKTLTAKAYPEPNNWSLFEFKTTSGKTENAKSNVKEVQMNDGEVAWYLVKKTEPVMAWAQRVFKKPLAAKDWEILKTNNPHLSNLVAMGVLQPGQVVIISNSTTAKELPEYKKQAQLAHQNLEEMKKDKDFDAEFFAQNYEFFYDALLRENTEIVGKNIFEENDHPLTIKFNQEEKKDSFFDQKMAVDGSLSLVQGQAHRVYRLHGELALKYAEEQAKGSGLANPKNFTQFKQKYANLYKELDQEATKKFLRWDQSIKTNNMRRMLKQSALVRDNNFKGGVKEYAKQMGKIGKFATQLKIAGYISIATDVVSSSVNVYEAAPEDKARTTVVETAKVGTGIIAGAVVSAIVIGLATGGTGLIVIGIVAVSGAMATKGASEIAGYGIGGAYDYIDEIRNK